METADDASRDGGDDEKNKEELLRAVVKGQCSVAQDNSPKDRVRIDDDEVEQKASSLSIRDVVEPNDHQLWNASWDSIDIVSFEIYVLESVRNLSRQVLSCRKPVKEQRQKSTGVGAVLKVACEKEFPKLEGRIASPATGSGKNLKSKRRIVPTAVQSVEVNEKFLVNEESVGVSRSPQLSSLSCGTGVPLRREEIKSLAHASTDRFKDMTLGEEEVPKRKPVMARHVLGDELMRLACLHGRVLALSSTAFMTSEIGYLFQMMSVDVSVSDIGEDMFTSGVEAVQYAARVLLHAGHLVLGFGINVLQDMHAYLDDVSQRISGEEVERLKNLVADVLQQQESAWGGLVQSPSFDSLKNTGCLTGHTGLNVFLNDDDMGRNKNPDGQRKLSNREAFRDSWFKLMKEAVRQSTSLSELQQAGGKVVHHEVSEDRHGDLTVLKLLQEESPRLLRGLRLDNYDAFAQLFVAAVLQAAATGETLMDEELRGIAKQNVSRFQSLNKRLQSEGKKPGFGVSKNEYQSRHGKGRVSHLFKRPQVDQSAQHALSVAAEFSKSLRPFVLFLEASDSHRLDTSLARVMKAKLEALVQSSSDAPTSLGSGGLLGIDEICVSTMALSGFLGYLSFTKGDKIGIESLCQQGEYDGTHHVDVLYYLRLYLDSPFQESQLGMLFKIMPWISRYLKFVPWNKRAADSLYFQRVFSIVARIRIHPYMQPRSHCFKGLACLCLRSMLDDLAWEFQSRMEERPDASQRLPRLDIALREDILWANANLGHRYVETACPDFSALEKIFSKKRLGSIEGTQAARRVRKITPTAPSQVTQLAAPTSLVTSTPSTSMSRSHVLMELEKVFLDQYSMSPKVTDIKLRDFVAWCSDAIARKGVAAGLDQAVRSCCSILDTDMKASLEHVARSCIIEQSTNSKGKIDKKNLDAACASMYSVFRSTSLDTVQDASMKALQDTVKSCSRNSVELLLPDAWGECVKMTAAAIIARRAEAAGTGQCTNEMQALAQARIRMAIEAISSKLLQE